MGIRTVLFFAALVFLFGALAHPKRAMAADKMLCVWMVQNPDIARSLKVANGVVTCTYDAGQFDSSETPLNAESAADVFTDLFSAYPRARKYVLNVPAGEYLSESFRIEVTGAAMRAAYLGKGESGHAHFDKNYIISHIQEFNDGLPVTGYSFPSGQ